MLCASIASVMGTEAIKLITGIGESLLGRLMIYDALAMSYRTIEIRKDPSTPTITELIDYERVLRCGVPRRGRGGRRLDHHPAGAARRCWTPATRSP